MIETTMDNQDRVQPPEGEFENDEEAREFGRQVAMDSLLSEVLGRRPASEQVPLKTIRFPLWRKVAFAAAAALVAALVVGKLISPNAPQLEGWEVVATGNARFEVLGSARLRLESGELRVRSLEGANPAGTLTIETPNATATATGTELLIGSHQAAPNLNPSPQTPSQISTMISQLTRVFVLSGTVSLLNAAGETGGGANTLLAATGDEKPESIAIQAGNEFAFDLYRTLSGEANNVFFSPFSISSALAMATE
mgnify:FL=1